MTNMNVSFNIAKKYPELVLQKGNKCIPISFKNISSEDLIEMSKNPYFYSDKMYYSYSYSTLTSNFLSALINKDLTNNKKVLINISKNMSFGFDCQYNKYFKHLFDAFARILDKKNKKQIIDKIIKMRDPYSCFLFKNLIKLAKDNNDIIKILLHSKDNESSIGLIRETIKNLNEKDKIKLLKRAKNSMLELLLSGKEDKKIIINHLATISINHIRWVRNKIDITEKDLRRLSPEKRYNLLKGITNFYANFGQMYYTSIKKLIKSGYYKTIMGHNVYKKINLSLTSEEIKNLLFSYTMAEPFANTKFIIKHYNNYLTFKKKVKKIKRKR